MSDVALRAGVSHQTVSRVLNDHPNVRPETRERVLAAITELGYRRNNAARSLVTRRTGLFGVLTPATTLFGPTGTLVGVESAARDAGQLVSVAMLREFGAAAVRASVEDLLDRGIDGLVAIAPTVDVAHGLAALPASVPVVVVSSGDLGPLGAGVRQVGADQRGGARMATEHLLGHGYREVVHLAGPPDWFDARDRLAGWRAVAGPDAVAVQAAGWDAADGLAAGRRLVAEGVPRAVFAANDQLALGLLHAFWTAGVRVPDDVAVVGFDDEAGAACYTPALTTVRQDVAALGRLAVQALRDADAPHRVVLDADLVVRASSGEAARTAPA